MYVTLVLRFFFIPSFVSLVTRKNSEHTSRIKKVKLQNIKFPIILYFFIFLLLCFIISLHIWHYHEAFWYKILDDLYNGLALCIKNNGWIEVGWKYERLKSYCYCGCFVRVWVCVCLCVCECYVCIVCIVCILCTWCEHSIVSGWNIS